MLNVLAKNISNSRVVYTSKHLIKINCPQFRSNSYINIWKDGDDPQAFLNWASNLLSIKELNDWYKVTPKQLHEMGGTDILSRFNGLPYLLLQSTYPNHNWIPWKFSSLPRNYWDNLNSRLDYLNWIESELKIKYKSQWYKVDFESLQNLGGFVLTRKYDSLYELLSVTYPEFEWLPWKFVYSDKNYFIKWQKKMIEWMEKKIGITKMEDWYNVTPERFQELGDTILFGRYNVSPYEVLKEVYPEYCWLPWKFANIANPYHVRKQRDFMLWVANKLNIKEPSDWLKISEKEFCELGGKELLDMHGSLQLMLYRLIDQKKSMKKV